MTPQRIAVALLAILALAETASACPFCKEALASSGGDLVSGFFYSILFMLSMPFLIFTGMGTYLYVLVRKARAAQAAAGQASPQASPSGEDRSAS
jgi:hypothetical protein